LETLHKLSTLSVHFLLTFYNFSNWSRQFPDIIIRYSVFERSAREGGVLRNFRYSNDGYHNTRIIYADWKNLDPTSGSGTFEMSLLDDTDPNTFYLGVSGSGFKYYTNIKLGQPQFQEIINLLSYKGHPWNPERERLISEAKEKAKSEAEAKKNEKIRDSINAVSILQIRYRDSIMIVKQRIEDSVTKRTDDSIRSNLKLFDVYKDGIVIKLYGNGHGELVSFLKQLPSDVWNDVSGPDDLTNYLMSNGGWSVPIRGSEEVNIFLNEYRHDKTFRLKFMGTEENSYYSFPIFNNIQLKKEKPIYPLPVGGFLKSFSAEVIFPYAHCWGYKAF